jgi:hypothetical protein
MRTTEAEGKPAESWSEIGVSNSHSEYLALVIMAKIEFDVDAYIVKPHPFDEFTGTMAAIRVFRESIQGSQRQTVCFYREATRKYF